ncbi:hydrogenase maturation protein [Noviherbaspirillum denitrificans]|uniref:Hydrogenase maturation protein n=1 Tax=Noviherbaspirillum denitrificans TaxID=1968433 RepID=A0A254TN08_9BURK|nr:hydrogenase maturation protein [Noviherbaspirillum denitrificans]OWW21088.1 hydrogenase maturation protein [Noviherbaspirillum denitrificans]
MRILFLTHSFNSLTQRLFVELRARGHEVSVELDIADSVSEEAVALYRPDLIVAPFLKRAVPASIWERHVCLIVHPGIVGDRGPAALDWAILNREPEWGVTVLQANAEMDAGDIWASAEFPMRAAKKSSLYRNEVTGAALSAVLEAVDRFARGDKPTPLADMGEVKGRLRPPCRQEDRRIDWALDDTASVLAKMHSGDGFPGALDNLFGTPCYLYDAHAASETLPGQPGEVVARRDGAVLRRTRDGAVWIGHARRVQEEGDIDKPLKLPIETCFPAQWAALPDLPVAFERADDEWGEIRYRESGKVGYLSFDFYNGAMSTGQCERLRDAVKTAKARPTRVLVLLGGEDFFSNGIHLNCIEAAAHRPEESAADESWRNINAMDDLALEILTATNQLTIAALRGNAGAGGAFLALAADVVWAHEGVLLNPHYKNMGNLYGSEYWTYLLPKRMGTHAREVMTNRLPVSAPEAVRIGLIDAAFCPDAAAFLDEVQARAAALASAPDYTDRLAAKRAQRQRDEAQKPLQAYRDEELARMRRNFYGFDPSYHVARYHFVHKMPHAWTPRHLAIHRDLPAASRGS